MVSLICVCNCPKFKGNGPQWPEILKSIIFSATSKCQQPCMPTSIRTKRKTFGYATTCGAFIISCNSYINHSFTCSKTWAKEPKRLKITKNDHFS